MRKVMIKKSDMVKNIYKSYLKTPRLEVKQNNYDNYKFIYSFPASRNLACSLNDLCPKKIVGTLKIAK